MSPRLLSMTQCDMFAILEFILRIFDLKNCLSKMNGIGICKEAFMVDFLRSVPLVMENFWTIFLGIVLCGCSIEMIWFKGDDMKF